MSSLGEYDERVMLERRLHGTSASGAARRSSTGSRSRSQGKVALTLSLVSTYVDRLRRQCRSRTVRSPVISASATAQIIVESPSSEALGIVGAVPRSRFSGSRRRV